MCITGMDRETDGLIIVLIDGHINGLMDGQMDE